MSFACAFLVVPCLLPIAIPKHAAFGLMVFVGVMVVLVAISNPFTISATAVRAWSSWLTYNHQDESAAGVVNSPVGTLSFRLGVTVLLVANLTLLLSSRGRSLYASPRSFFSIHLYFFQAAPQSLFFLFLLRVGSFSMVKS